jgi:hypothetical protein
MATGLGIEGVTLAIIIGVLAAIVYSLRIMMLLERRIARMDMNLLRLTEKVLQEEMAIAKEEKVIEKKLGIKKKAPKKRKR